MSKRTLARMDQNSRKANPSLIQIDKLIKENNQLKIEKVVLQKEMDRIVREYKVKDRNVEDEIMGETIKKNYEECKKLIRDLEEKIYVLENENNLLKINNEFQRKALLEADDNSNFSQFSGFSNARKGDKGVIIELKEKVSRLELIRGEQESKIDSKIQSEISQLPFYQRQRDPFSPYLPFPITNPPLGEISRLKRVLKSTHNKSKENSIFSNSEGIDCELSLSSIQNRRIPNESRLGKSFQNKCYEDKEKVFNSLIRRAMIQIASSINSFVNEEVSKNQDTLIGMEISCKLEELRQKLIKLINTKISIQA